MLDQVKFARPCGIELTFVPVDFPKSLSITGRKTHLYYKRWDAYLADMERECRGMEGAHGLHTDPSCIEFPSPILNSWTRARDFYEEATDRAWNVGLTTFHEDHEGGMGHIHVSVKQAEVSRIAADIYRRPYLTWIFASPNAGRYCESFARTFIRELHRGDTPTIISNNVVEWQLNVANKFSVAPYRRKFETIEFRCFDAAADWSIQEEHLAFVQRYMHVLKTGTVADGKLKKHSSRSMLIKDLQDHLDSYGNDLDRCVREFKELIVDTLELPWKRYSWYIDRNLVPCFEWGKRW